MSSSKPALEKPTINVEDDLDDLDDVLTEFTSTPSAPPPTAFLPTHSGRPRTNTRVDAQPASLPGRGPPLPSKKKAALDSTSEEQADDDDEPAVDEDLLSAEFAKELAKGMENLMRDIAEEAGTQLPTGTGDGEQEKAFRAAWEAMLVEEMNGKEGGGSDPLISLGEVLGSQSQPRAPSGAAAGGENFQDKIKQAMGKVKEMEDKAKAAESSSGPGGLSSESMDELFKSLKDLGLGDLGLDGNGPGGAGARGAGGAGAGEGESEAELAGFLESMMGQLMSKDILYDPLKELSDGFPPYLANPPKPLSDEDKERYGKQYTCVKQIVAIFEQPSYSDSDAEAGKKVVDLMSEMQTYGSPPPEIMGPLPPGFDGTFPGLNPNDENCVIA